MQPALQPAPGGQQRFERVLPVGKHQRRCRVFGNSRGCLRFLHRRGYLRSRCSLGTEAEMVVVPADCILLESTTLQSVTAIINRDYFFLSSLVSFFSRKRKVVARQFTFIMVRPPASLMSLTATLFIFTIRGRLPTATKKLATL